MAHEFSANLADQLDALDPPQPTDEDLTVGDQGSDLDDLDAELAPVLNAPAVLEVILRPGYAIECRTDFTGLDLEVIRKKCRDKKYADGIDGIKFSALLIAATCTRILRQGEPLELDGTSPVTFATRALQTRMGTTSAADTVRKFIGLDGHVDNTALKLRIVAGWGDEVETVDPTQ